MQEIEQLEYFEAIEWFGKSYDGSNGDIVLGQMYKSWPSTTLLLANQGFFICILQEN